MTPLEQELIEKIHRLSEAQQQLVLDYIEMMENEDSYEVHYTAQEFIRLSPEERNRILRKN